MLHSGFTYFENNTTKNDSDKIPTCIKIIITKRSLLTKKYQAKQSNKSGCGCFQNFATQKTKAKVPRLFTKLVCQAKRKQMYKIYANNFCKRFATKTEI